MMNYDNEKFYEFQLSAIKYIVEFFTDEDNFNKYKRRQSKTIPFLKNHSSVHKEFYFNKVDIFIKALGLDSKKVSYEIVGLFISHYTNKDSKIIKQNIFEVNQLFDSNIYVYLKRGYLNDGKTKGASTLYPILNFHNRCNLDFSIPIDLEYTKGEKFSIYDCHDFKIFASSYNGGNHRTAGIVSSLGLLRNCKINNKVEYHTNYFTKDSIESFKILMKQIDDNSFIDFIEKDESDNRYIIKYKNKVIATYLFEDLLILLQLVNLENVFQFMENVNITLIEYTKKNIIITTEDNEYVSSTIENKLNIAQNLHKVIYFYNKLWNLPNKKQYFKKIKNSFYYGSNLYSIAKWLFNFNYKDINNANKKKVAKGYLIAFIVGLVAFLYYNPHVLDSFLLKICNEIHNRLYLWSESNYIHFNSLKPYQ